MYDLLQFNVLNQAFLDQQKAMADYLAVSWRISSMSILFYLEMTEKKKYDIENIPWIHNRSFCPFSCNKDI